MTDANARTACPIVIFVHGTFSYDEKEELPAAPTRAAAATKPWWQRQSGFFQELSKLLQGHAICIPAGQRFVSVKPWWMSIVSTFRRGGPAGGLAQESPLPEAVFHWSGDNSEQARRLAGELLLAHLRQFGNRPLHVVAHSHGGNVLWECLCCAVREHSDPNPNTKPLANLQTWTTVGTPFLHFRPDPWVAISALLPLLVFAFATWKYFLPWLEDFWTQAGAALGYAPLRAGLAFCTFVGTLIVFVSLCLHTFRTYYRHRKAARSKSLQAPGKEHEFNTFVGVFIGMIGAAVLTVLASLVNRGLWTYPAFWVNFGIPSAIVALWTGGLVWTIFYYVQRICAFVRGWRSCKNRSALADQAGRKFGAKGLCLAVTESDEGIRGLGAIAPGIEGQLLPRTPSPGRDDFSKTYRHLRRPERELEIQSFAYWFTDYLLIPLAIIRQYVFHPLYNYVFAGFIDRYVLDQLHRRAFGLDIQGLELMPVTDHPCGLDPATLSVRAATQIKKFTAGRAPIFLDQVRSDLLADQPAAMNIEKLLKMEFADDQGALGVLVHNAYFESDFFTRDLAYFIASRAKPSRQPVPEPPPRSGVDVPSDPRVPSQPHFLQRAVWALLTAFLSLGLVAVIYALGIVSAYRYSGEREIKNWAGDKGLASAVAVRENLGNITGWALSEKPTKAPAVVRWWLAYELTAGADSRQWAAELGDGPQEEQARFVFLTKMGQKYGEMNCRDSAERYLRLAVASLQNLDSEQRNYAWKLLAKSVLVANSHLVKQGQNIKPELTPPESAAFEGATQWAQKKYPLYAIARQEPYPNKDAQADEIKGWYKSPNSPRDVLRRIAYVVTISGLAFDEEDVATTMTETMENLIKEQKSQPRTPDRNVITDNLRFFLSVTDRMPAHRRRHLCDLGGKMCEGLGNNEKALDYVHGKVAVAATLRHHTNGVGPNNCLLARFGWLASELGSDDGPMRASAILAEVAGGLRSQDRDAHSFVYGGYAMLGDYRKASNGVKSWSPELRLFVATQILLKSDENWQRKLTGLPWREVIGDLSQAR